MISPHELACAYDRYAAALWRGDVAEARAFAAWFEGHWADEGPPELANHSHAVSVLGGAGAGIRWYTHDRMIVGYVGSRAQGCYQVPMDAAPPPIHLWDGRPGRQPGARSDPDEYPLYAGESGDGGPRPECLVSPGA